MRAANRNNQETSSSIKDFEIIQRLGEGAYGTAFKVRDKRNGEIVVMKQIALSASNPGELADKMQECMLMNNLRHPYICRFKHSFCDQNKLCIINEYCDKGDLAAYLKNQHGHRISEQRIKRFIVESILAIDYLHSQNIIHRDLKPSNIFLKSKDYTVQLGDFGTSCMNL